MSLNNPENRRHSRAEVPQLVRVRDALQGTEVGKVVNISTAGFMLIGANQIRENCLYQLEFCMESAIDGRDHISLGAECLWVNETGAGDQNWAGFHIVDVADNDRQIIDALIQQLDDSDSAE